MRKISLNGAYRLFFSDQQEAEAVEREIPAQVPGNVEIDLMRAGILPDLYFGENVKLLRPYEFYQWRYEKTFSARKPAAGERAFLHFGGVDLVAAYCLNGVSFAHSENALIDQRFDVSQLLRDGENTLSVSLSSPILYAAGQSLDACASGLSGGYEALHVRKAPSAYGWDIMPRVVSAGLWRDVTLEYEAANEIEDIFLSTIELSEKAARIACVYRTHTNGKAYAGLTLVIRGECVNGSCFETSLPLRFPNGRCVLTVENPALWWPAGYGKANLYEVHAEMRRGEEALAVYHTRIGIRTAVLEHTPITDAHGGEFVFRINGEKIFCKGANWVPADALHSRDASRYEEMIDLFTDTGCNILRCWGGNVYEDHAFFDLCDQRGIMVWQDFAMACGTYPQDDEFLAAVRAEAESVVAKLRIHPSLILWSGDNECDACAANWGNHMDPAANRLTREILPQVISRLDPYRSYLPSSPYLSPEAVQAAHGDVVLLERLTPEQHLWGPRDYYKSDFYTGATAHFVSETGYHGCNNLSSIRTFIDEAHLWPWEDNPQWLTHAAEMEGPQGPYAYRIRLMAKQIHEMFGMDPDNLPDFILASQISQAEAKKFFIELTRTRKWRRTGVIWWNMIDGWPQFSDAVVSYDFGRKLAYYYIRRAQAPVCLMLAEPAAWHIALMAGNDTRQDETGTYRVWDADTEETLSEGHFDAPANGTTTLAQLPISHGDQRLFLMRWTVRGETHANHYMLGTPPFSFARYRQWLEKIAALDDSFVAENVGK